MVSFEPRRFLMIPPRIDEFHNIDPFLEKINSGYHLCYFMELLEKDFHHTCQVCGSKILLHKIPECPKHYQP